MNAPDSRFELGPDLAGKTSRLMFYVLLAIILMSLDHRERWVHQVRAGAGLLVEPVWLVIEWPFRAGAGLGQGLRSQRELVAEAGALRLELARVSADLLLLDELRLENIELRALLGAGQVAELQLLAAEIRRVDLNPFSHRVLINRGRTDGLVAGQPVIDAGGLVGQLDEVFLHSARVILLTDPDHALPVRIQRTGLRTIAYGSGLNGELRLTDLPMNVDLDTGDLVLTSGLGGVFPAGLPVAHVARVERHLGEAFATATLRPLGRPDRSRHLLVLDPVREAAGEEQGTVPPSIPDAVDADGDEVRTDDAMAEPDGPVDGDLPGAVEP